MINPVAAPTKPTGPGTQRIPIRAVLIVPAGISLLVGLNAALQLLGVPAPINLERLPDVHGLLMTLGFVGTLIALERSVALGKLFGYLPSLLMGLGGLLLISPAPVMVAHLFLLGGTLGLSLIYLPLWRRNRDEAVLIQATGAVMATVAPALLIAGFEVSTLLPWLGGFVILTIGGERLELARMVMGPHASATLVTMAGAYLSAAIIALMWPLVGYPLLGGILLIMTCWLAFHDVAKRTINAKGAVRFMAACMLAAYFWLALAGALWMTGPAFEGERYDALIHAVFIGFTMSMIMAHATVILPAVIRRPLPYRTIMWVAAGVVHFGLVLRIWVGDGLMIPFAHQLGGFLSVIGLLAFFLIAAWSAITGLPPKSARAPATPKSDTDADAGSTLISSSATTRSSSSNGETT